MLTRSQPIAFSWVRLLCAVALCQALSVFAQPTAPGTEKEEVVQLDRYLVTGSHLPLAANTMPQMTIDAAEIDRGGVQSNVLELLRKQAPAFAGSGNIGSTNGSTGATSTYGGAKLALHNMPTLVLLNGRRVSTSGANARGGTSFVDVNQFPVSAIERIEVVTDGATAIYGSDAIGGVVNIILKKDYNGSEIGSRYAFSTRDGDYSEKSGFFTTGVNSGRISVLASGNYFKSTPLYQTERPFSSSATSTSYSGVVGTSYLNPTLNSPSQVVPVGPSATAPSLAGVNTLVPGTYLSTVPGINLAGDVTLLTEQEKKSAYASLNVKLIGRKLEAFGDVLYTNDKSFSQLGAQSVTFNGTGTSPQQITGGSGGTTPYQAGTPTPYNPTTISLSPAFRYLPATRRYSNDATLQRFTAGLKGEVSSSWVWETAYTYNKNKLNTQISNVLYGPNLDLAVLGGYDQNGNATPGGRYSRVYGDYSAPAVPAGFTTAQAATWLAAQRTTTNTVLQPALDPFAYSSGINPASLANVLGTSHANFTSGLDSIDVVLRGEVFQMPAGSIAVAIGGDRRVESLKGEPDDNSLSSGPTAQRWSGGTFFDVFDKDRNVTAGFLETSLPVTSQKWNMSMVHSFDLTFAYRVEHYSDAGRSSSPRYGARWQPFDDQVTVRYTYSKSFSAPTLFQLFGTQQGLTSDLRSFFGLPAGPWQATSRQAPNESLDPTISRNQSLGVVLAPKAIKGLTMTFDYSDNQLENFVGRIGSAAILQSVDQLGTASPYAAQVTFYNFPGQAGAQAITAPGQVKAFLLANPANTIPSTLYIIDPAVNLSSAIVRTLDVGVNYEWTVGGMGKFELGSKGTFIIDDKIQSSPGDFYYQYARLATSAEGTMPAHRFYTSLNWQKGSWDITFANTYIARVDDIGSGGSTFASSTTQRRIRLASYLAWDLGIEYTLNLKNLQGMAWSKKLVLGVGVNNIADEMPPSASQAFPTTSGGGADSATYGAIGRLYYVSASLKF